MARDGSTGALILVAVMAMVSWAFAGASSAQASLESSVKANYLVRFTAFVGWPASAFSGPQSPVTICVVGGDPFGPVLDRAAAGQTAHGRPLAVRRPATLSAAAGCHIVYLATDAGAVEALAGALVVTDATVTTARGALHFVVREGRVRFHIDQRASNRQGLVLNSRLLNLALSVQEGQP